MYTLFLIAVIVAEKFFDWYRGLFRYCSGGGCLENRSSFVNFLRLSPISKANFGILGGGGMAQYAPGLVLWWQRRFV